MTASPLPSLLRLALLGFTCWATAVAATDPLATPGLVFETVDGIVAVEAEHFATQDLTEVRAFHVITTASAPYLTPDPDPNHAAGASGHAYLEILPDNRITHDEPLVENLNFSNVPGKLAVLSYRVKFHHPGRYYFWARNFSTNTEDNGLHVGLNGEWPESGQRWQTVNKHSWQWDCKQRTEEVHVGVPMQLFLDIPTAGEHTIQLSMREDGHEIDKWILARDIDFRPQGLGPSPQVAAGELPPPFRP